MGTELQGQTVVVIGGSAGIGFETARRARAEGAKVVITGRDPDRLQRAAIELDAAASGAFDAHDATALDAFFQKLPNPIDQVLVTAGSPHYGPLLEMDPADLRRAMRLTRIGASSRARLVVSAGSTAVSAPAMPRPRPGRRPPVPPTKRSDPPGRTRPTAFRATRTVS